MGKTRRVIDDSERYSPDYPKELSTPRMEGQLKPWDAIAVMNLQAPPLTHAHTYTHTNLIPRTPSHRPIDALARYVPLRRYSCYVVNQQKTSRTKPTENANRHRFSLKRQKIFSFPVQPYPTNAPSECSRAAKSTIGLLSPFCKRRQSQFFCLILSLFSFFFHSFVLSLMIPPSFPLQCMQHRKRLKTVGVGCPVARLADSVHPRHWSRYPTGPA